MNFVIEYTVVNHYPLIFFSLLFLSAVVAWIQMCSFVLDEFEKNSYVVQSQTTALLP